MLLNCCIGEDSWESLGLQGIKPVSSKGNQSWILIGRTNAEAQVPISQPPDMKSWLIRKDPDARKDWVQEEKGMTEDEIVGWHHWLNGHKFEPSLGDGEGQGSLVCCSPWVKHVVVTKQYDTTIKDLMIICKSYIQNQKLDLSVTGKMINQPQY